MENTINQDITSQENIDQKRDYRIWNWALFFITAISIAILIWILGPFSPPVISFKLIPPLLAWVILLVIIPITIILFFFSIGKILSFLTIGVFLLFYYTIIISQGFNLFLIRPDTARAWLHFEAMIGLIIASFVGLTISTIVLLMVRRTWQTSPEKYTKLFQIFCVAILLSVSIAVNVII